MPLVKPMLVTALCLTPALARADTITVFAAASLANALALVEPAFEGATGHDLAVSLAGSSALARQIQQGAPAAVFLSASTDWMDVLAADDLLAPGTRVDLLGNTLVLIAHGAADAVTVDPGLDLAGMLGDGYLAMAMVESVPAGIYGKAALESLGLWASVAARVAQTDNVRAALVLVATGEAPFGIVYATDAIASPEVSVIGTFPAESHAPIIYPAAVIAGRETPAVTAFMDFLNSDTARAAFESQGFSMLDTRG